MFRSLCRSVILCAIASSSALAQSNPIRAPHGVKLDTVDARPACDVSRRGLLWTVRGGASVADDTRECRKDASDVYAWSALGGGGSGTVTEISAGAGLTGGTINVSGTIAIDFAQSPIWTGTHELRRNAIGTTPTDALILRNQTPATLGAKRQHAPALLFEGHGWDTDDAIDRRLMWRVEARQNPNLGNEFQQLLVFGANYGNVGGSLTFKDILQIEPWPYGSDYDGVYLRHPSTGYQSHFFMGSQMGAGISWNGIGVCIGCLNGITLSPSIYSTGGFFALYNDGGAVFFKEVGVNTPGPQPYDGFILRNLAAATVGAQQQYTPALGFVSQGWGTTAGASQLVKMYLQGQPSQATVAQPTIAIYKQDGDDVAPVFSARIRSTRDPWIAANLWGVPPDAAYEGVLLDSAGGASESSYLYLQQYYSGLVSNYYKSGFYLRAVAPTITAGPGAASSYYLNITGPVPAFTGASLIHAFNGFHHQYLLPWSGPDAYHGGAYAETWTASGALAEGDVACSTGTTGYTVIKCAAAANSTAAVGVVIGNACTDAADCQIMRGGRVLANCESGIAARVLVGTSGATAGRVAASTPGAGQIVGLTLAAENEGAPANPGANKCWIDLRL